MMTKKKRNNNSNNCLKGWKVSSQVKVLVPKSDDLSFIPQAHLEEGDNSSNCPLISIGTQWHGIYACTHKYNTIKNF